MPAPRRPAPKPPPPRPAPRPPPSAPAARAAVRAPAPRPTPKPAPRAPARGPARAAPKARPASPARAPAPKAKPPARKPTAKPPARARAPTKPKPRAPQAKPVKWWSVTASREVLGGVGACRRIEPRGYSELSTNPGAALADLDFAALGHLPCLTVLIVRNPANGKEAGAVKQDVGAGSSFHPVMGLYPQTLADLGLDTGGGEFHVQIRRQDGKPLRPAHGTETTTVDAGAAPPDTQPATADYVNPLAHANVTGERIDQGVDYAGTGYLVAIADGIVTESVPDGSGWEGEGYLEYKITQPGELEGASVYGAEGITPVVHAGERVSAGARIADLRDPMPHGIELGFAAGTGQQSYYRYHDGNYVEGTATRPGIAFDNLVRRLGGPAGRIEGPVVGKFPEYMQSGEPAGDVTSTGAAPGLGISGASSTDPAGSAATYDFANSLYSAFVQIQRGATNAARHSNAAKVWAAGITYVAKSD